MEHVAYTKFDPEKHLGGVLEIFESEGWTDFSFAATCSSMIAPGVRTIVAVAGTEVAGVVRMQTDGVLQAHISLVVVGESHRRRGIGRRLVEEAFARSGAGRVDLTSSVGSEAFYESFDHRKKSGFRIHPGNGAG